jgi:glycosyltransferase involved in cell wall biosynthesis
MRIGFIYRGDPRHRTANRLSMLQNIAAAKRLGHEVVLIIPREGMSRTEAKRALAAALDDFGIRETIPVKCIPRPALKGRGRRSFDFLAACWARAARFDLIWSREFYAADYASAFGLNTILEHHHPFTTRQWKVAKRLLRRKAFKALAAITDVHRQVLLSAGWPEDKVIAAHSGVDLSHFARVNGDRSLRGKFVTDAQPLIVYAGSLYKGKGCEQILLAAERMHDVKFVCVGGRESEVRDFKKQVTSRGLTNIEFAGHVPHADVARYLRAADVLVAPFTRDARDIGGKVIIPFSSPLKLFEYMAAGKPIVASNVGAIPEIIAHEENGLLVAPSSVDELVAGISRLLRDGALAERLAKNARNTAERYTWEQRVTRILEAASRSSRAELSQPERVVLHDNVTHLS